MSADLLPCPFCGGPAELVVEHDHSWIRHETCPVDLGGFVHKVEAAVAWNRRAVTDAMKVRALFAFQHSREYDLGLKLGHALEAAHALDRDPKSNEVGE